jgi:sugar transferase (PEP-CTERM/EpsH1 system associated)
MRILALTPRLPWPPVGGDKLRAYAFLSRLSRRHQVDLLSFVENAQEEKHARELARLHPAIEVDTVRLGPWLSRGKTLLGLASREPLQVHYYRSARMRRLVEARLASQRYDAVYVHLLRMAQYVEHHLELRRVLDMTDAISMVFARAQAVRRDWFRVVNAVEWGRVRRYEPAIVRRFDATVLIAEIDARELARNGAPAEKLAVVNNGVDRAYFMPTAAAYDANRSAFVGNLHSFANADAALRIAREILPAIRAAQPDACADIVGVNPSAAILAHSGRDGLNVTGAVDDVRPYVERAALTLCPVRVAGGVQNKILESLALGVPVVTSPEGFEGLGARGEDDGVRVARDTAEFAKLSLELMRDVALRNELGRRGNAFIARSYDWDRQVDALEAVLAGR